MMAILCCPLGSVNVDAVMIRGAEFVGANTSVSRLRVSGPGAGQFLVHDFAVVEGQSESQLEWSMQWFDSPLVTLSPVVMALS